MKNWSLKLRLSTMICLALLSTTVTIYIISYVELRESLLKNLEPALKAMTNAFLSNLDDTQIRKDHEAGFHLIADDVGQIYPARYQIWKDGSEKNLFVGNPLAGEQDLRTNLPPNLRPDISEFVFLNLTINKEKYQAVWTRHPFEQGIVNVLIATSSDYVYHEMGEFLRLLFILGASLIAGSFLLVPTIVSWALRPIDEVSAIIKQVSPGRVKKREQLNGLNVPEELLPFVKTLNEMLSRLDKTLTQQKQFIADASHELRTPLAVIKSTIQTTRMADREVAEYIETLDDTLQDVNRMEQLIEHLLSLARLNESMDVPNMASVDLNVLLAELTHFFDSKMVHCGGKVVCEDNLPTLVPGNEKELNQLFTNILDNAVKYGPQNGTIRITLSHESAGTCTVCIHDEGGSIPAEALPRIFDRFYRVDSSRSRATGGTGLGLAIAKEIVSRHGGQIEISSDKQSGTSVFIRLPRIQKYF